MTHTRRGFACVFALVCAFGSTLPATARAGDIIVRRDAGLSAAERAGVRSDAGVKLERVLALPQTEVVSVPDGREDRALAALEADPGVRFAVPDIRVHAAAGAPDPFYGSQWALESGTAPDIDVAKAWPISEGADVTVAVVDQQVDTTHPDLVGSIAPGGRDFTVPAGCAITTPMGLDDHGTYVAGVIAARRENGIAIAGVAPEARVLPLRALDNCGEAPVSWILEALRAAGLAGAPIVAAAFGTDPLLDSGSATGYNVLFADVFRAYPNTLFVVPAGNEGNDNDELPVYPCSTIDPVSGDTPNLICTGMTTRTDAPVCWGNVGAQSVDLFAPGVEIYSTVRGGILGVQPMSGTSSSVPIVAAIAALVKSLEPTANVAQLKYALMNSVGPQIPGLDAISITGGRVNAARAVDVRSGIGANGPGGVWQSCDKDHDTVRDGSDDCPLQWGTVAGCPDTDLDSVRDLSDNCVARPNSDQANADGDGAGDACDVSPRGDDADGDGKGFVDDACPYVHGTLSNGCPPAGNPGPRSPSPTPSPTPSPSARVVSLGVKVTPKTCPRGRSGCAKSAKVTLKATRSATVSLRFEQRVRRGGKSIWRRVTTKSIKATTSARSLTVKRLKSGSYRVTARVAGTSRTKSFRV